MSRIRKSTGLGLSGPMTSAAPVSPAGCITLRSNAAGTALEVSYNTAAYTTLGGGGGGGAWSALTVPTADLILNHGAHRTAFTWSGVDAEDCLLLETATDAPGSGTVLYVRTQGASTSKAPLRVDAKGAIALAVDVNGMLGVGIAAGAASRVTIQQINTGASEVSISQGLVQLASGSTAANLDGAMWTVADIGSSIALTRIAVQTLTLSRSGAAADNASLVAYMNIIDATVTKNTGTIYGTWIKPTVASSKTVTNWYGVYLAEANVGGGSAITNKWGFYSAIGAGRSYLGETLIMDSADATSIFIEQYAHGAGVPIWVMHRNKGTRATPATVVLDDALGQLRFAGSYDSTAIPSSTTGMIGAIIQADASGTWTSSSRPAHIRFRTGVQGAGTAPTNTLIITSDARAVIGASVVLADALTAFNVKGSTTESSDGLTTHRIVSAGDQTPDLSFESFGNIFGSPLASATNVGAGTIRFKVQAVGPVLKEIASIRAFMDGSNAVNPAGKFIFYLRASGSAVLQQYMALTSTLLDVSVAANFYARAQFTPSATLAGLNVGSVAGDPSGPSNGDLWYDSTANELTARINGANVALGAGGGGGANTALSNLAAVSINLALIPQTGLDLGAAATAWRDLYLYGSGTFATTSLRLTGTPTGNRVITIPNATATLATLAEVETLTNKTLSTGTAASVAIAWADGITQTFNPNGTSSGINVGSNAGAPSAPSNGDIYYDTTNGFQFREGAAWASWRPATPDGAIQYRVSSSAFGSITSSSVSGANVTWGGIQTQTLTNTSTAGTQVFLDQNLTLSPASSAAAATFHAFDQSITFGTAQAIGPIRMRYVAVDHNQSAAVTSYYDTVSSFTKSVGGNVSIVGGWDFTCAINAGTTAQATGVGVTVSTGGGIITAGYGYTVSADHATGSFTTFTGYRVTKSGTITNPYGFASSAGFLHGFGTLTPTVTMDVQQTTSATTGLNVLAAYDYTSSGTPAATFGQSHVYRLKSSTTANQSAAQLGVRWQTATHASRCAVYGISTVTPMGLTPTPTLGERWIVGGMKALTDNTVADLFAVSFGTTDHKATGGFVRLTIFAKQTTGSNQIQAYVRVIPWAAIHNAATNTGAATWGSEALGAAVTSTGGFTTLSFRINTSATMPQSGVNLFTFQILVDSDLTTPIEMTAQYDVSYSGELDIALS